MQFVPLSKLKARQLQEKNNHLKDLYKIFCKQPESTGQTAHSTEAFRFKHQKIFVIPPGFLMMQYFLEIIFKQSRYQSILAFFFQFVLSGLVRISSY